MPRLYAIDDYAFERNDEPARYFVGLLMSDGNVLRSKLSARVTLGLKASDIDVIFAFRAFLGAGHPIRTYTKKSNSILHGRPIQNAGRSYCYIAVHSKALADSLAAYGVVPAKSLTAKVIGLEMCPHFWRGVIDGDGTVSFHKIGNCLQAHVRLVGSEVLVGQFAAFARAVSPESVASVRPSGTIWVCSLSGLGAASVVRAMYRDRTVALRRKAEMADRVMEWEVNRIQHLANSSAQEQQSNPCKVEGCDRRGHSQRMCKKHLGRLYRKGRTDRDRHDLSTVTREQITGWIAEHKTWLAVAKHTGINRCTLARKRRELGMVSSVDQVKACEVDECYKVVYCKGRCVFHYSQSVAANRKSRIKT